MGIYELLEGCTGGEIRDLRSKSELSDLLPGGFHPMKTAPKDGTEIEVLVRHFNWQYAGEGDREKWEEICRAYWTDFNGGGWVWHGMCGDSIGWRKAG